MVNPNSYCRDFNVGCLSVDCKKWIVWPILSNRGKFRSKDSGFASCYHTNINAASSAYKNKVTKNFLMFSYHDSKNVYNDSTTMGQSLLGY